jgi:hypothetical protein
MVPCAPTTEGSLCAASPPSSRRTRSRARLRPGRFRFAGGATVNVVPCPGRVLNGREPASLPVRPDTCLGYRIL